MILAPDRELTARYTFGMQTHPRVHFRYDGQHPAGASHHQKIVVIDDRIAFCGGLDFTRGRWDTRGHRPRDPLRADTPGENVQPYHDVQLMVSGEVAADLGDLARSRWANATGEHLQAPPSDARALPWPAESGADLENVPVAVSRTFAACGEQEEVREIERLLVDAIASADRHIYIENQYFTAPVVCEALQSRLQEPDGPEIALVLPRETVGWMSQNTMDVLRERRLRQLQDADHGGRLGVYYPDRPDLDEQCINLHAKVLVVDDDLLSVGSANLNNRSMSLDSECNLSIEAAGVPERRQGIASLRNNLLAEHLGVEEEDVRAALDREGSLLAAIEALRSSGRSLRELPFRISEERDALVPDTSIADPECPIDADYFASRFIPDEDRKPARRGLISLAILLVITLLLAAAWRWTPLGEWVDLRALLEQLSALKGSWIAPLVVVAIYVIGGFLMFPVTVLIVGTGLAFGAAWGFGYALLGAELSALASYAVGHALGHESMRRLSDRWVSRASRFLGRQGLLAMITLRIVPVAPFTVVNLVAGASHIGLRDFALGTLLGLVPGTLALVFLSGQVTSAVRGANWVPLLTGVLALPLIGFALWGLRRWIRSRQDAPT
jgi:phospholipase D1/2